jgi:putative proteasome-type protease
MTYCVAMLVDTGLVLLSDSRTNAGVDQINTFRKIAVFQRPGDRVLVLLTSGNLAATQAVVTLLHDQDSADTASGILSAPNMFEAALRVGAAVREVYRRGYFTSTRPAISSSPRPIRPTFRLAKRNTANLSSTA